ncbi:MAG: hypothetical protein CMO81_01090 [Waddliaceae bacterium]|nr:hypothetical protein [Waddliaceae bacterium]
MDANREEKLRDLLDSDEKTAAYVMVRCSLPGEDGKMEVEMMHAGDTVLALYLLENAQEQLQGQLEHDENGESLAIPDQNF